MVFLKESATLIYNPGQGIWSGMRKSGGAGRGRVTLISTCACFLTAIASLISVRGGGGWPMASPKFEIFLIFPDFQSL